MTSDERRSALKLCGPSVSAFMERCEFISLGCYCAPSYAMQLLNLRKNSYPFDWTRSSLEGVLHCMDMRFEDFLTYSTYNMVDQHVVFGGTRATRLRADYQLHPRDRPSSSTAAEGQGIFFFSFTEEEFRQQPAPNRHPLSVSGARCADAIAASLKWWSGEGMEGLNLRSFDSIAEFSKTIYQFDGGDPARELFVPRRFWGQQLNAFGDCGAMMERLLSVTQQQAFVLPIGVDASKPFPVQCFGRYLQVHLPPFAHQGLVVQLFLNSGQLSGVISSLYEGQLVTLAQVQVEDRDDGENQK
eukprot:g15944.t1